MENINIMATTNAVPSMNLSTNLSTQDSSSDFAMSPRGYAFAACVDATDHLIDPSATIRERQISAKGHVGFAARTWEIPAWSPPLC